jgi:hypothetical protein
MSRTKSPTHVYLLIVVYLLVAAVCLAVADHLIVTLLTNARVIGMSGEGKGLPHRSEMDA